MQTPMNYTPMRGGKVAAICQCCGKKARATAPNSEGEPDLWAMPQGWSEAPFFADTVHSDGSTGSMYTCPACNKLLRAGRTLARRDGGASHIRNIGG